MEDFCIDVTGVHKSDDESENIDQIWSDEDEKLNDGLNYHECISLDVPPDVGLEERMGKNTKACGEDGIKDSYITSNYTNKKKAENDKSYVDKLLQEKSSIKPGLELMHSVPMPISSKRLLSKEKKKLRSASKGKDWYNIPATEVTEEIKNDLDILRMRRVLDSKHVYKHNDMETLPKFFQIGKIVEGPADFYNGRIPKAQRKQTLVEELLADAEFKAYQKKKYKEIVDDNRNKKFRKSYKKLLRQKKKEMKVKKERKGKKQHAF